MSKYLRSDHYHIKQNTGMYGQKVESQTGHKNKAEISKYRA